ncbi:ABC-type multidrug transport system ATPase subunit [Microbacterium halimionae]|uniref:ABC-type multidrug transport system ATPase subunit n=1 Tax=Microbacterium halimionae TaxID=1526413 RepID=A0A7W3JLU0_9MICO|nr:ABC transporter ATP-binding protein [Microbacterium halimionae]MBA8815074.1 ABC-type multidrug transport system ATPase subunit [Microbacterium halimionae]NII94135.1 ABC-type multidrug transport system ATPase subunit [Microbacterium halimionae]
MTDGQLLEFSGVTKRFGGITAVNNFQARIEPGVVTGFLGPNGAGKTTTLRVLLGLVAPTSGTARIGGKDYSEIKNPLQSVGAVLEASSFHPGRSAANHLKVYARAAGIPISRIDETLALVGLTEAAGRRVGGFSLGMRQRLGLAVALLGDPGVLILDEPSNGLDPEGIKWMRGFLRQLARDGRTVLMSSHLLAEIQQTADALLVISRGKLVYQGALADLVDPSEYATIVDSPDRAGLSAALARENMPTETLRTGLVVHDSDTIAVGAVAARAGIALSSLQRRGPALEEVFLDLVSGVRVHPSGQDASAPQATAEPEAASTSEAPADAEADAEAPETTSVDDTHLIPVIDERTSDPFEPAETDVPAPAAPQEREFNDEANDTEEGEKR